jgi:hypothetical protein
MESRVSLFERLVEDVLSLISDKISGKRHPNEAFKSRAVIISKCRICLKILSEDLEEGDIFWACKKSHNYVRFMRILLAHLTNEIDQEALIFAQRIQQLVVHEANYENRHRLALKEFFFTKNFNVPHERACHPDDFPKRVESLSVFSRFHNPRNRRVQF